MVLPSQTDEKAAFYRLMYNSVRFLVFTALLSCSYQYRTWIITCLTGIIPVLIGPTCTYLMVHGVMRRFVRAGYLLPGVNRH